MKIKILNARVAFAHGLFKASAMEDGQTPKYGADFILDDNTKVLVVGADKSTKPGTMKDVMLAVANEAWKGKGADMLANLEASKKCHRDGNKRLDKSGNVRDGYAGNTYVTAKSATRPGLFDAGRRPITEEDGVIYSGCYVNAIMDIYAVTDPKRKGVFAGLTGVQFSRDGDSFGGGSPAKADEFEDVAGDDDKMFD